MPNTPAKRPPLTDGGGLREKVKIPAVRNAEEALEANDAARRQRLAEEAAVRRLEGGSGVGSGSRGWPGPPQPPVCATVVVCCLFLVVLAGCIYCLWGIALRFHK